MKPNVCNVMGSSSVKPLPFDTGPCAIVARDAAQKFWIRLFWVVWMNDLKSVS